MSAATRAGDPMVVELNPLPGILPDPRDNSCFPKAARAAGMDYDDADPHRGGHRLAPDQRPAAPRRGGLMKIAIIYDAGSAEWSPQDVAAVLENIHEVRSVCARREHEVELCRCGPASSAG